MRTSAQRHKANALIWAPTCGEAPADAAADSYLRTRISICNVARGSRRSLVSSLWCLERESGVV